MTPANATAVRQMMAEIETLVKDQPQDEAYDMIYWIRVGCNRKMFDLRETKDPVELAHDREIRKADDKFKVRRENP